MRERVYYAISVLNVTILCDLIVVGNYQYILDEVLLYDLDMHLADLMDACYFPSVDDLHQIICNNYKPLVLL
jgi:hypothetical protein